MSLNPSAQDGSIEASFQEFYYPPEDPIKLFNHWNQRAIEYNVLESNAMALATVSEQGRVSNRMIRVMGVDDAGMLFASHSHSQKGKDLTTTEWASGVLYWPELRQQVILAGRVKQVPEFESDQIWLDRPVTANAMSVAARQSERLDDEEALRKEARQLAGRPQRLARPAGFRGYRMALESLEFWHEGQERLHLRLRYLWESDHWNVIRLHP